MDGVPKNLFHNDAARFYGRLLSYVPNWCKPIDKFEFL